MTQDSASVPVATFSSFDLTWRSDSLEFPLAVIASGDRLVVADRFRFHLLTVSGAFLESRGRRGAGPGEFGAIGAAGSHGDTIVIYDEGSRRLSLFDGTGQLLADHPLRPHPRYPAVNAASRVLRTVDAGALLVAWPRLLASEGTTFAAIVRLPLGEAAGDTATVLGEWPEVTVERRLGRTVEPDPFGPHARLAVGAGGRWAHGDGQRYCVTIQAWREPRVLKVCRDWERQRVRDAVLRPEWAELRKRTEIDDARVEALQTTFQSQDPTGLFPSYDRLWFAESGDLWVRTIGPPRAEVHPYLEMQFNTLRPPTYSWDVFDTAGNLTRTVRLPSTFEPYVIRENEAFGLVEMAAGDYAVARVSW